MGVNHFQRSEPGRGPLPALPPGRKLAGALALILMVVWMPRAEWYWLLTVAALLAGLIVASGLAWRGLLKRLLLLEPLVLGVAGLMLFQPEGGAKFVLALGKTNLCLLTTLLLSQTTRFSELLGVLQRLRVPWLFVTTLTLMHRYLFVLAEESERMRRAVPVARLRRPAVAMAHAGVGGWPAVCARVGARGDEFMPPCAPGDGNERH